MKNTQLNDKGAAKLAENQASTIGYILAIVMIVPSVVMAGLPSIVAFIFSLIGFRKAQKAGAARRKAIIGMVISLLTIFAVACVYIAVISQYLKICSDLRGDSDVGACIDFFMTGKIM